MTRRSAGLAAVLGLTLAAPAWSAPPQVKETSPLGVQKGVPTELTISGANLSGKKGERIVIDAQCSRIGSGVDPSIRLTTAARAYIASADDSPGLLTDARLAATLPEDTDYVIEISDSRYQGGARPVYRLVVGA